MNRLHRREFPGSLKDLRAGLIHAHSIVPTLGNRQTINPTIVTATEINCYRAIFWYPLAKASTLGLLHKIDEGKKFAEALMELKPDSQERGRILIGRYVKFDDITDRIIEGLATVGIEVR